MPSKCACGCGWLVRAKGHFYGDHATNPPAANTFLAQAQAAGRRYNGDENPNYGNAHGNAKWNPINNPINNPIYNAKVQKRAQEEAEERENMRLAAAAAAAAMGSPFADSTVSPTGASLRSGLEPGRRASRARALAICDSAIF